MSETYTKLILFFIISLCLLVLTNKIASRIYTLRFITGYYTFQFAALFIYLLTDPDALIWNSSFSNYHLRDYIDEGAINYLIFQLGILLAALIGYPTFKRLRTTPNLIQEIKSNAKYLIIPLTFTAIVILTYPLLKKYTIGYASSILFNFLNFIPFLAGVLFFIDGRLRLIWIIALVVLFILGILTGGRGAAFTCSAMYAIGFYYALITPKSRRIALIAGIIIAIPLASFMAFVGIFRSIVGRVDFDKINWDRAVRIYEKYEKIKDSKVLNLQSSDGKLQSWGRLVNFVNFYQFATIPAKRKHLGYDGLISSDFRYSFDIAFLSGTTLEDRLRVKAGNYRLNDYGYHVTPTSSVEYSVVSEGYIRFGSWGVFFEAIILGLFCQSIEYSIRVIARRNPALKIFTIIMLCQQALLSYAYNLFPIMRSLILAIVAAVIVILSLQFIQLLLSSGKARNQ